MTYPTSVWFIVCFEFCERFSYYGLQTVLVLYLTTVLRYGEDSSTVVYHMFVFLAYFTTLFGAILSDSYLGKFKTILYLSVVYAIGFLVLTWSSLVAISFSLNYQRYLAILGLVLIAIGSGGIKPCVPAFGGDQFNLPTQEKYLQKFFSIFYFAINAGSVFSTPATPELREGFQCFGRNSCFPLAFGVPALLFLLSIRSIVLFVCGKRSYKIKKPDSNVILTSFSCIYHAIRNRLSRVESKMNKSHWLCYADDRFTVAEISDVRSALDIMYLFIPLPFFWALFDQQGSRWTFQATLMNGKIDFLDWTIKPDQMQVINPIIIMLFIPLFETVVYPILTKIRIRKPLQKIALGGFLAALAFVLSALLQKNIIGEEIQIPDGVAQLRVYNGFKCNVSMYSSNFKSSSVYNLSAMEVLKIDYTPISKEISFPIDIAIDKSCSLDLSNPNGTRSVTIVEGESISYFLTYNHMKDDFELKRIGYVDDFTKPKNSTAALRILNSDELHNNNITLRNIENNNRKIDIMLKTLVESTYYVPKGKYEVFLQDESLFDLNLLPFSSNTLVLQRNSGQINSKFEVINSYNHIHLIWQLPQIIVMAAAEIMFSITAIEFAFTQAPLSMKSLLSSAKYLTVSFGNLIVVIVSEVQFFENHTYEYLLFAGLMVFDMLIFILMSYKYKYKTFTDIQDVPTTPCNDQN